MARLIHGTKEDIAFLPNAGHSLALAMSSIDWEDGDEMLTLHHEFPNQLYGHASVNARSVECDWHEFDSHVSARTRLVALSTVNYTTGLRPNLQPLVKDLRARGIVVYLDGTQSCGALEFNCAAIAPDFFAVDAYKWMISPNGATFIYVNPEMRRRLPPNVLGWRSDKDWRNVTHLHHGAPRFGESAEKYEPGMMAFASLCGMDASLRLIEEIGIAQIEKRVLTLADTLRTELAADGRRVFPLQGRLFAFADCHGQFARRDSAALAKKLAEQNINISARRAYLRISPHFYNNEEDLAALLAAIRKLHS